MTRGPQRAGPQTCADVAHFGVERALAGWGGGDPGGGDRGPGRAV